MDSERAKGIRHILEERTSIIYATSCWEWQGAVDRDGYGKVKIDGITYQIHRLSAELFLGFDPTSGLHVLHDLECPFKSCWNPDHLYIGTHADNMRDMKILGKNRITHVNTIATHCVKGHEFTDENTGWSTRTNGTNYRYCKECKLERTRKSREKLLKFGTK